MKCVRTVFDIRWLLEGGHLDQREAILRKVLVRYAYSCLEPLLCLQKLLALQQAQFRWVRLDDTLRSASATRTGLTTKRNGTPCVRDTSLEKWNTLMTLSASSASSSSRGISYTITPVNAGIARSKRRIH